MASGDEDPAVVAQLRELIGEHQLAAAHAREFIPDDLPASAEVRHALNAAVEEGVAIGLQIALELLTP